MTKNIVPASWYPYPPFNHCALRRNLSQDDREIFQSDLCELTSLYQERNAVTVPSKTQVNRDILSLEKHLASICRICPPDKPSGALFAASLICERESDERKLLLQFPILVNRMHSIVAAARKNGDIYITPTAMADKIEIAMSTRSLLVHNKIRPTVTTGGVWFELTKYVLHHACGRNENTENIKNILKKVIRNLKK